MGRGRRVAYQQYLRSPQWKAKRTAALARAGYKCEQCEERRSLHVHHLTYKRFGHENPEDLRVLCSRCHMLLHREEPRRRRRKRRREFPDLSKEFLSDQQLIRRSQQCL